VERGRSNMDCRDAREYYSEYLENGSEKIQAAVSEHLSTCPRCREEVRNLGSLIRMMGNLPEAEPGPDFLVALNARIDSLQQGNVVTRFLEGFSAKSGWPKALAVAATLVLIVMATFYAREKVRIDKLAKVGLVETGAPGPARERTVVGGLPVSSSPPAEEVIMRTAFGPSPAPRRVSVSSVPATTGDILRSVGYGISAPDAVEARGLRGRPDVSRNPASLHIGTIPPPSRSKAAYPDRVVILRARETEDATEQIRGLVKSLEGQYLVYGPEITLAKIPIELNDHFIQAMESLGEVREFEGPIDRSSEARHFLIEVIVLPELP